MRETADYLKIVRRAQLGDRESMDRLAQLAQGRVFVYIYRLTLSYDLSQDLIQETMLEMIRSLKKLKKADRFWPWLFRTALGKVQHYFRSQGPGRIAKQTIVNTAWYNGTRIEQECLRRSTQACRNAIYEVKWEMSVRRYISN